jgi:hypothetical protein
MGILSGKVKIGMGILGCTFFVTKVVFLWL